ncbi:MAG: TlyA family RNA methyltransferase, partial [Actinomycetota bacterium]|nr:TlyA family RNA methyltransferase [Actinomycetota bacterium]
GLKRVRLDQALVAKTLFVDVAQARQAIDERKVSVNGAIAVSHGFMVAPSDELLVIVTPKYVSRGGLKLEAAIRDFDLDFADQRVLDVGASTGGFTDCALQHGARQVVAVDIGKNLLHEKIASDPRVVVVENTNAREIKRPVSSGDKNFAKRFDIAVVDLSFISAREVLPAVLSAVKDDGILVLLIKPQFEATKAETDRGAGVISDRAVHARVTDEMAEFVRQLGCDVSGTIESPIRGHDGNREFLLVAKCARVEL